MARVADVAHSFFVEPDMAGRSADAKYLLLWAIVTDHGNQAGLFTIAKPIIAAETSLPPGRLDSAFGELREAGKVIYDPTTGALWVVNRAKRPRSKTEQIAKSIAASVRACPSPRLRDAFLERYRDSWLRDVLLDPGDEPSRMTVPPISFQGAAGRALRAEVFTDDDFTCQDCGWRPPPERIPGLYDGAFAIGDPGTGRWLQVDHIVPRALGGTSERLNLQTLCDDCNVKKGALDVARDA